MRRLRQYKLYKPEVWNSLPFHIKTFENLIQFKSLMKNWNEYSCKVLHAALEKISYSNIYIYINIYLYLKWGFWSFNIKPLFHES